jgi:hydroxymethylpyrimidine/phosphomethylpyrimidine kinase
MIPKILIIAGSDSCGGAGIQADIKTATACKVYAATAITCLTAQTTKKIVATQEIPPEFLRQQIEAVLDDIKFDAIKIGMLQTKAIIHCVADILDRKTKNIPLILDPVMVATSGDLLLEKNAFKALKSRLVKGAYIITPNIYEAQILAEIKITNIEEMKKAAFKIKSLGSKAVLVKGGHLDSFNHKIYSVLLDEKNQFHLIGNRKFGNENLHGTGCTLASALACNIAKKIDLPAAVRNANKYVYRSIVRSAKIGKGSLLLQHF